MGDTVIREITPEDNAQVAQVIRKVFEDMGVPKVGTAYADKALDDMYSNYNVPKAAYFVVEPGSPNGFISAAFKSFKKYATAF